MEEPTAHEVVRAGFAALLDTQPDVRMPGMDGIEATRLLTSAGSGPRVLVLTTFDLDECVYDASGLVVPGTGER